MATLNPGLLRAKGERWFLMLEIYMDDSGTHGGPYCFLAGYLASTERWATFADKWKSLCDLYLNGNPFRTSTANRGKDPGYVPEDGMLAFAQCISDHVEVEVWSVLTQYYSNKIQERYGIRFDPYRTCFLGVIEAVINNPTLLDRRERLAWVFDHHGGTPDDKESGLESSLIRAFNDTRSMASDSKLLLHSIAFADDEDLPPLQAADFLAWHHRRRHADGFNIPERASYEILAKAPIQRIEVVWFDHKLEDLLDRITKPINSGMES